MPKMGFEICKLGAAYKGIGLIRSRMLIAFDAPMSIYELVECQGGSSALLYSSLESSWAFKVPRSAGGVQLPYELSNLNLSVSVRGVVGWRTPTPVSFIVHVKGKDYSWSDTVSVSGYMPGNLGLFARATKIPFSSKVTDYNMSGKDLWKEIMEIKKIKKSPGPSCPTIRSAK